MASDQTPGTPANPPPCNAGATTESASADAALLARLRAGDDDAFEELVRTQSGRMLAVARRILDSDDDAKDAVQDAFLSAFRSLDQFQGGSLLSTWLHRICVNAALMKLRTRRRKPERSIETLLPSFLEDGHHEERFSSWSEPVDKAMERAEMQHIVRSCIAELPENYRTVLILRDVDELDTDETAARMGLTPNAVKIRLHRARQALRTLLDPHFRSAES